MEPQKLDTRQYYDGAPIGVWLVQTNGRVVFVCRDMWEWMQRMQECPDLPRHIPDLDYGR